MKTALLNSPAKINLTLKILGFDKKLSKHKLSSKVVLLRFSDNIKISKSNNLCINYIKDNSKIIIKNDIVKKTIKYFDKKYDTCSNFDIVIHKNIPVGYGLGGGSSNAATILKFLYDYNNINIKNYYQDAPIIGSDVLLFKDKYPKIIDGLHSYKKLKLTNPRWKKIFILFPSKINITKKIFGLFKKKINVKNKNKTFQNDLLYASMIFNEEFKDLYNYIEFKKNKLALWGMSGSGSSIFLSFKSNHTENSLISDIRSKYPLVRIEKSYYFS